MQNGNSNVAITAGSNVTVGVSGNSAVLTVTGTGANIAGTANVTGNLSAGNVSATRVSGKVIQVVRDAGTVVDGGTLTIDFTTDSVVHCTWGNGMTLNYQNYLAGSVVKVIAQKNTGTGTDSLNLGGITASHTSTGTTTTNYAADLTAFIELTCTGSTLSSVYAKL